MSQFSLAVRSVQATPRICVARKHARRASLQYLQHGKRAIPALVKADIELEIEKNGNKNVGSTPRACSALVAEGNCSVDVNFKCQIIFLVLSSSPQGRRELALSKKP